jgi:hypothetical protein
MLIYVERKKKVLDRVLNISFSFTKKESIAVFVNLGVIFGDKYLCTGV